MKNLRRLRTVRHQQGRQRHPFGAGDRRPRLPRHHNVMRHACLIVAAERGRRERTDRQNARQRNRSEPHQEPVTVTDNAGPVMFPPFVVTVAAGVSTPIRTRAASEAPSM